jgi:putative proteasome-type protease
LHKDREHKLFLIYPEGNWVEISRGTPYHIIGASGYGKPVLDRTLKYEDPMRFALKVGCLAFDSTRISAADVDFPVDIVLYARNTFHIVEHRFEKSDLAENSNWWQERLRDSVRELPTGWMEPVLAKLREPQVVPMRMPEDASG